MRRRESDPLTKVSDRLQSLARDGRPLADLLAVLDSVSNPADLLEFDNFGSLEGKALAQRSRQLGAATEDATFLEAKGALLGGDLDRAAEILEPFAASTTDRRLLHAERIGQMTRW